MTDKLPIQLFTNPILHKTCTQVTEINDALLDLIGKMFLTMKLNNGIGLSANQVGINMNVCVANLENQTKMTAFINPKIIYKGKHRETLKEGCLSCPGVMVNKKRYKEIHVESTNMRGERDTYKLTDLDARILQHEIDHLSGTLILSNYMGYCNPIMKGE
jgi:peptide deformylase